VRKKEDFLGPEVATAKASLCVAPELSRLGPWDWSASQAPLPGVPGRVTLAALLRLDPQFKDCAHP